MGSDCRAFWMALSCVEGLGDRKLKRLYDRFGSVEAMLQAPLVEIARLPGFHPLLAEAVLASPEKAEACQVQIERAQRCGIQVHCIEDPWYPQRLRQIPDAPCVVTYLGRSDVLRMPAIAVVGTRFPTEKGQRATRDAVATIVHQGFAVVSGFALGVDQVAHTAAMTEGGRTIAVLPQDLASLEAHSLGEAIQRCGGLLSEHVSPTQLTSVNLVRRNRLISGLAASVLVMEGRRGAWHTAHFACVQGRQVILCDTSAPQYQKLGRVVCCDANEVQRHLMRACPALLQQEASEPTQTSFFPFLCGSK